ncbi:MAG: aldehyde ferredoxin oxidoreductase family protein [Candidatus Lokiarchaeota archaeon]|nr:aldehyde ferredoxin oxidoreductase family protein [Candidatus Lokiarchaeota archaeon]
MVNGYTGNILRVDLTNEKIIIENPEEIFYRRYIGGEGFVAYYLLKELKAGIDPLSAENKLIFATGPLTGFAIPGTGRNSVGAKSPLTGGFGEAEVGGHWGAELKHAGFDAIIIEGKAKKPVYLWIKDGDAEIKNAIHLWGKVTGEAEAIIKKELSDQFIRVAQIGSGGENLVRYACIINDLRNAAGRTGMGAVMGSKNLKAIAVRGHKKLEVINKEKLRAKIREFNEVAYKTVSGYFEYGTGSGIMEQFAKSGNLPTRNFRDGNFKGAKVLDPGIMKQEIGLKMESCYACSIRCKKVVEIGEPWNVNPLYGGPEYESIGAFGSNCGVDDLKAVCKANELCNKYSIDTISTGVSISFAMECYENGIISDNDTNGIKLNFGNAEAVVQLVEMIAKREGLGDILAEGVKKAAEKIKNGADKFAMHVKGQEIPMHEPRLKQGLGVGYTVSPTGAEHMANMHDTSIANENSIALHRAIGILEPLEIDDLGIKKIRALVYYTNWRNLLNALLICYFVPWDYVDIPEIVRSVTGWYTSSWELMKVGERITTMARAFNVREGLTKKDDWLPERFFQPHTSGALAETAIKPNELKNAIITYYKMMGWDEDGIPTKSKLEELELDWICQYL